MSILTLIIITAITTSFARCMQDDHERNQLNDRPIIAILAQLTPPDLKNSYIAASYVKYLESSGARVIPIPSTMSIEEAGEIFEGVNGVLFPGGSVNMSSSGYSHHARLFYDRAIDANKQGDYFPIWGTCLGFETLHVLTANNESILSTYSAVDISLPLNFTDGASKSRMFNNMSIDLYKSLSSKEITYNHHMEGISPDVYAEEQSLNEFFNVLSLNNGLNGRTFVSTVEAKNYPFYGTQWHPEKNNFEHIVKDELHMPHSFVAVQASQYMANFFVNEARKNHHKFPSKEIEQNYLIYNYNPVYTGKVGPTRLENFEQVYYF